MNATTGRRGRTIGEDGRRQAAGCRWASRFRPPASGLFSVLCLLVFLAGCDGKALEQAQREAREAKVTVQQLKHNLGLAEKEIANVRAELNAVRQSRDELQQTVDQAGRERDQALEFAQKAQEAMTARSSGQVSATAALQQQIAELNALVAAQQKEIDQLQKSAAGAGPTVVPQPQDQTPPAEPNEGR